MSEVLRASDLYVESCTPDCSCQSVHVMLHDTDGNVAAASVSPETARAIAADLQQKADLADARLARLEGRLA